MNEDILIRFRWTADELLNGYQWHYRHRIHAVFRVACWFLIAAFIIGGAYQVLVAGSLSGGLPLFFAGLYILFYFRLLRPWLLRRQFARRPDRDAEIEWRISADRIHARGAHGTSDFTWPALAKVVETPAGFLFYPTEQIFHWLPRSGFSHAADFDRLSQLAQRQAAAFHRST